MTKPPSSRIKHQSSSKPPRVGLTIDEVLQDWGISDPAHPLRLPVSRILSGGSKQDASGLFHLKAARALLTTLQAETSGEPFKWEKKPPMTLEAEAVAKVFGLSLLLKGALVEIKMAALGATREASRGHVEVALSRVEEEIGEREAIAVATRKAERVTEMKA